jgi:hypothetical protein
MARFRKGRRTPGSDFVWTDFPVRVSAGDVLKRIRALVRGRESDLSHPCFFRADISSAAGLKDALFPSLSDPHSEMRPKLSDISTAER